MASRNHRSFPWRELARGLLAAWAVVLGFAASAAGQAEFEQDPVPSAGSIQEVVHILVGGPIDTGTQSLVRRGIQRAKSGPRMLVVELDTPGGEMELMFRLATQIADANKEGVRTVAWIHDRAYSAGALVALACDRIYMRSEGVIGASLVVQPTPEGGLRSIEDPGVAEKINAAVRSAFRAFAESHGRPAALAEAMVDREVGVRQVRTRDGETRIVTASEYDDLRAEIGGVQLVRTIAERGTLVALSGSEAVALGLADGLADTLAAVLDKLGHPNAKLITLERSRSEDFAAWLSAVRVILIGLGVMALMAEFKAPGFGFAGVVAMVCFGLVVFGNYLVGLADVPHLVAVGLGLALVAVELFLMPGAIYPGAIGAALIFGGLAFAQVGPEFLSSPFGREVAVDNALELMAGIVVALIAGALISRFLPRTPVVGRMVLSPTPAFAGGAPAKEFVREPRVGERGVARTPLRPVGKIQVEGSSEELEARSSGKAIEAGARVKVIAVEGLRAVVEVEGDPAA